MTSALQIAIALLLGDTGITNVVGQNVFAIEAPELTATNYILVYLVGENEEDLVGGNSHWPESRISVECVSTSQLGAVNLGEAVKNAFRDKTNYSIAGAIVTIWKEGSDVTDAADDRQAFRRVLDFTARWRGA